MLLILLGYFLLKLSFLVARVVFIFKAVVRWQIMLKLDSLPSQGKKGNGLACPFLSISSICNASPSPELSMHFRMKAASVQ
jgi:hypothetical protein